MSAQPDWSDLRSGDALGYFTRDPIDVGIAIKTWCRLSHVEVYSGGGLSVASRNGIGVNRYQLRKDGLAIIRRPLQPLDLAAANHWFETTARGQKYDWIGLLCFTLAVKQGSPRRMFCSEFMTRFYRRAQFQPFDHEWDADKVPPSFILVSPEFETIWKSPGWMP